ncbi:LytR/AlgR family response regulator transcription factor [Maribacter arenosus]|uniref:Response regulator transcription factor n=1 Tax=Maribacter arenosus TaxID=1854708 RepID=A0ABR7VCQ8_9FLAO|nr:LytTR family DNA-binding domain-containing protein [Maribacter arenosus]MBD0851148.1 response regulator transcription factor [Maribacter arenosus]
MKPFQISCIVVDDEPMALQLIEGYVLKTPFLVLKKKCDSAIEALTFMEKEPVDLVFLDIQMPDLTGIGLSKLIPKSTRVIFTTAFSEYALEGFKVEALDYLLKPFDYAEFLSAATKAKEWFSLTKAKAQTPTISEKKFLFVKSDYKQLKIHLDNVLYFEGLKDYIKIWLKDRPRPVLTLMSLKSLQEVLPADKFMRIHRSFIVALEAVDVIERSQVIIGDKRITVSENYKPEFLAYISKNSLD